MVDGRDKKFFDLKGMQIKSYHYVAPKSSSKSGFSQTATLSYAEAGGKTTSAVQSNQSQNVAAQIMEKPTVIVVKEDQEVAD